METPLLDALQTLEDRSVLIARDRESILQKRGWKHTSSTPGSRWMWEKILPDGRMALVDIETAIRFEIELSGEFYDNE